MYDTNSSLERIIGQKNDTPKSANKFSWSDNAKNNEALFPYMSKIKLFIIVEIWKRFSNRGTL